MSIHIFQKTQLLSCSLPEAWSFFSDPKNLKVITPPEMGFDIVGKAPEKMYAGMLIQYIVKPLFNIPTNWLTEITQVQEPHFFIDEQRVGPYQLWHHQHHFKATEQGVEMQDIIHYIIPLGFLGDMMHPIVKNQLNRIFDYRTLQVDRIFNNK
jgi:ligand-binding SRPBCC domain-containing protein